MTFQTPNFLSSVEHKRDVRLNVHATLMNNPCNSTFFREKELDLRVSTEAEKKVIMCVFLCAHICWHSCADFLTFTFKAALCEWGVCTQKATKGWNPPGHWWVSWGCSAIQDRPCVSMQVYMDIHKCKHTCCTSSSQTRFCLFLQDAFCPYSTPIPYRCL